MADSEHSRMAKERDAALARVAALEEARDRWKALAERNTSDELKGLRAFRDQVLSGSWCQSTHCAMEKSDLQAKINAIRALLVPPPGSYRVRSVASWRLERALNTEGDVRGI